MHLVKYDDLIAFTVASLANVDLYEQAMTSSQLAMVTSRDKNFGPFHFIMTESISQSFSCKNL